MTDDDLQNYNISTIDAEVEFVDDDDEIEHPTVAVEVTYSIGDVEQDVGKFAFRIIDEIHDIWEYLGEEADHVRDGKHRGEIFEAIVLNHHDCYAIKGTAGNEEDTVFAIGTDCSEHLHIKGPDLTVDDVKRFKRLSQDFDDQVAGSEFFKTPSKGFPALSAQSAYTKLATYYWKRARYETVFYKRCRDPVRDGLRTVWKNRAKRAEKTADDLGAISA